MTDTRRYVVEINFEFDGEPLDDNALLDIVRRDLITETSVLNIEGDTVVLLESVSVEIGK
jgi:hypothetical protein